MKAIVYHATGAAHDVLQLVDRAVPEVRPGHVRVRVAVSGVNPTDYKSRSGQSAGMKFSEQVPGQDGAGTVDAVAEDVRDIRVGDRVWIWEAAFDSPSGTAQEYVVVPARQMMPLPDTASFDLGACLGIPALTAHRALTSAERGPYRLGPGTLAGTTVLVQGGAGAVGNAAIQLANWSGAVVVATVSSPEKAQLARNAGAHHIVDYRTEDVVSAVSAVAPNGVERIVEVDLSANLAVDTAVIADHGNIGVYTPSGLIDLASLELLKKSAQFSFIYTYTTDEKYKNDALADVNSALSAGALGVGTDHGLPLHRFDLAATADAHAAVEDGAVGRVLVDVSPHR